MAEEWLDKPHSSLNSLFSPGISMYCVYCEQRKLGWYSESIKFIWKYLC